MLRRLTMYRFGHRTMNQSRQLTVDPVAAIPGGEVAISLDLPLPPETDAVEVWFGDSPAHFVAAASKRLLVLVPDDTASGELDLRVEAKGHAAPLAEAKFIVGRRLASGVHPVTNPAFAPSDHSLFVTKSGSRGEHVPVSIYRVTLEGQVEDFSGDITNPTAIAFDGRGQMFVSSRFDGSVYRVTPLKEVIDFANDLGIATGLAIRGSGEMFVGDRTGTIYRVNEIGEADPWAQMEPSVSAYHLAFGPDDELYATGPTVSSFDCITRFDSEGQATVFYRGLGRPQGLAFDRDGNLYVAAAIRGRRGIVRISPDGRDARLVVAGMNVVGLAFSPRGEMIVATNDSIYSLPLGIEGTLLE